MTNPGEGLIRRARTARGLSAAEVAHQASVSTSTVLDTETRPWATIRQLARYADILGYDLHVCYREPGSKQCAIELRRVEKCQTTATPPGGKRRWKGTGATT